MVEELGAQKMMLEDRVSQLQATVEDLEVRARCSSGMATMHADL